MLRFICNNYANRDAIQRGIHKLFFIVNLDINSFVYRILSNIFRSSWKRFSIIWNHTPLRDDIYFAHKFSNLIFIAI